jgi:abortive infection bacteriophage resistance protein
VFRDDTHFKDIIDLYIFDRELRLLIMDMVERIEISIRSVLINELSLNKKDPFCYLNIDNFTNQENAEKVRNYIYKSIMQNKYKQHDI